MNAPSAPPAPPLIGTPRRDLVSGLVAALIAFAVYASVDIVGGHFDEYYHVLAGISLLHGEGFALRGLGNYDRAPEYTAAVAASMALFGETLWAARLPSMLSMAAAVGLVTFWAGRLGGWVAGALAGALLLLNPLGIYIGTMSRFYAPQVLLVLLVFMVLERAVYAIGTPVRRLARAGLILVLLFAAYRMQPTSVFPAATALTWLFFAEVALLSRRRGIAPWRDVVLWAIAFGGLAAAGVVAFLLRAQLAGAWHMLRDAAAWSADHRSDFRFYHKYVGGELGWWWSALPLMTVLAVVRGRMAAILLASLVFAGFVGQTLAGMKSPRYISYILPAMSILLALGLVQGVPVLAKAMMSATQAAAPRYQYLARPLIAILSLMGAVWFVITQPPTDVVKDMLDHDRSTGHPYVQNDWGLVNDALPPERLEGLSLIASAEPKALFHLGRVDAGIGAAQLVTHKEGELDPRTGRPTLATVAGLQRYILEHPRGMMIAERDHYRRSWGVTDQVADYVETHLTPIDLGVEANPNFIAWAWGENQHFDAMSPANTSSEPK